MIEALFRAIPYLRRPYFQRDVAQSKLHTARRENDLLRQELDLLKSKFQSAVQHATTRLSSDKLVEISGSRANAFFLSKADDARQDQVIGDLRAYVKGVIQKEHASLEIGPSYNPILPKREGYNVSILDHDDEAGLVKKYTGHSVDTTRIEPVDYVWHDGSLSNLLGDNKFDYIVAAHVIEHAPDFIQFLNDSSAALHPTGCMVLFVPDKRYCFDYFQPLSDPAKVLGDHLANRSRHSFESYYRNGVMVLSGGDGTWGQNALKDLRFLHGNPESTLAWADARLSTPAYEDAHENYFTPISFSMLIDELCYLRKIDLRLEVLTRSRGCEFLAILRKTSHGKERDLDGFLKNKLKSYRLLSAEEAERIFYAESSSTT
jgi:2-polyprenyl-3-methyl-5-hydroxy-6-metoxy-1,4-benzoquinol methylase